MVLYLIVSAARNIVGDLRPFVSVYLVRLHEHVLLGRVPAALLDFVVEIVVPSLAALLAVSIRARNPLLQLVRNYIPLLCSEFINEYVD